ncbi:hypothetical protein AMC83_CH01947 [Rhizobium phaseoli]|uniref:hypothetical protein n=1 Tax=Rhizobium phaseoli TaxID=396 RepID=UPI0007EC281B|nr:hypothetical protein [Rhizobium phaseoli]ANL71930.1 hypothetical protein AMC83_CH01947 [Rhizobium phaseoli]
MNKNLLTLAAAIALCAANAANAATWERPAGSYTPTNHSANITKYQIDRANGVAISSAKVDGDINKAFEGLNSLEARVAPSVVGQSGKFLTNNGAATSWGLISSTSISSGAATSGQVLKANGSGSTAFGLLDTTSFANLGVSGTYSVPILTVNTAGQITSITSTNVISGTTVSASTVSATNVSATNLQVSGTIISTSLLPVATGYISTTTTGCSILKGSGLSSCTRISTGVYGVSFTTPMSDALYKVNCTLDNYRIASWVSSVGGVARPNTTDGFYFGTLNGTGTVDYQDSNRIMCVVFP